MNALQKEFQQQTIAVMLQLRRWVIENWGDR